MKIQTIDDVFKALVLPLLLELGESILTEQSKKWQSSTQAGRIGGLNA